ncbi:hypothetical protein BDZ45DRAFT_704638 [Acephala macrosclerotiorum]|nr:hypothetical protein BDZ45DRAFT_704638 [Acephala macrosclerotiorum]
MSLSTTRQVYRRGASKSNTLGPLTEPIGLLKPTKIPVHPTGIPRSDASGSIIALGSHATKFQRGDRVSLIFDPKSIFGTGQENEWLEGEVDGVLADFLVVGEGKVMRISDHLGWEEASCLVCAGVAAWSGLAIREEDEDCWRKEVLTINYSTTLGWELKVLKLNSGIGVDIVLQNGGVSSLMKSVAATATEGIISKIGYLGKQDPKDLLGLVSALIRKAINLRGINVGSRLDFKALNRVVEANEMHFEDIIDRKFPFREAEEVFKYSKTQTHIGKVVIEFEE